MISRPSRIDTPELISVPSVRVKRDTADLRSTSPSTGRVQHEPVDRELAVRRGVVLLEAEDAAATADAEHAPVAACRNADSPITMRVGSGSARLDRREHVLEHRDDEDQQHA